MTLTGPQKNQVNRPWTALSLRPLANYPAMGGQNLIITNAAGTFSDVPIDSEGLLLSLEAVRDDHRNVSLLRNLRIRYGRVIGFAQEERYK